jgi:hypothetical protein
MQVTLIRCALRARSVAGRADQALGFLRPQICVGQSDGAHLVAFRVGHREAGFRGVDVLARQRIVVPGKGDLGNWMSLPTY